VLVLSQFAGAAQELKSALIVNPYDIEATARAFTMPLDERKDRWHAMMAALRANSVHDWASHFLQALANEAESEEFDRALDGARSPGSGGLDRLSAIGAAPRRAPIFVFDQPRAESQSSERSFARSALFHWYRALRAHPRPATRSLEFYNTTSLWFPEWKCFHVRSMCGARGGTSTSANNFSSAGRAA
jgi:hypothetical protein